MKIARSQIINGIKWQYEFVLWQKNTPYGGLGILKAVSPLPLCLSGGDQMMPQGIIQNSLGDALRHHQGVKGHLHQDT